MSHLRLAGATEHVLNLGRGPGQTELELMADVRHSDVHTALVSALRSSTFVSKCCLFHPIPAVLTICGNCTRFPLSNQAVVLQPLCHPRSYVPCLLTCPPPTFAAPPFNCAVFSKWVTASLLMTKTIKCRQSYCYEQRVDEYISHMSGMSNFNSPLQCGGTPNLTPKPPLSVTPLLTTYECFAGAKH